MNKGCENKFEKDKYYCTGEPGFTCPECKKITKKKFINKTEDATLWELIGFPIGFIAGLLCFAIVTIILKGWSCLA